jgi:hypothetical protein
MFRRSITTMSLLVLASAPLAAQAKPMNHDPDKKVAGGALPAGWMGRTDKPDDKISDAKFVTMGPGYHVTSGPAAIYWSDKSKASGAFTASATFKQTKNPTHPEAYGLVFQGSKLDKPDVSYVYFLVRGDGKFMVNHRAGEAVHKIVEWTDNAAVHKSDAAGVATNTLSVDATKPDSIRLLVNGTQVHALGGHVGSADGIVGLRVNHNLDVHISDFAVTPKKK